ncbi:MAG: polyprenyl diphosphate synthase [Chloroflexota bacterium]|nr:polyprenyl diphosphate synthase [Chloroflexota bacterium]
MANEHGLTKVPGHLAIIMDGNGRWARQRGLPRLAGHQAGTDNIRPVLESCVEYGVKMLTLWAFSTENWGRPKIEVRGLLKLLDETIDRQLPELHEQGVCLQHIGRLDRLPRKLQNKIREAIALTHNNETITLNVAFDYGGRAEILQAVQRIIEDKIDSSQIDGVLFGRYLYTADLPDPDLVIRTSGEFRTSNFMIWQAAYAEYYITPTYWPDFDREKLYQALLEYSHRERRFGLVRASN